MITFINNITVQDGRKEAAKNNGIHGRRLS